MNFPTSMARRSALLLLGMLATATAAHAQGWPERAVKLLAPSAPGAPPDVYARALAEQLSRTLGQPVVVENVPAGGGLIAAQQLQRAKDGHTLLVNTAGMMTITPNANPLAKYRAGDFTQICQGVEAGLVLAASPQIGAKTYGDLANWVRAQNPPPTYSSYSLGSPAHFLGYQWSEALHVDMIHVPYRSSPQQVTDMLGGVAPLGFVLISTASPHIQAGKLVAYAVTGSQRSSQLPNVPTVADIGLPQLTTTVWFGLTAPKDTPPAVVQRLTEAHEQLTGMPEFKARMAAAGLETSHAICGDRFLAKMNQETERWARIIKATGFVAN